jgi:hypothetical protein
MPLNRSDASEAIVARPFSIAEAAWIADALKNADEVADAKRTTCTSCMSVAAQASVDRKIVAPPKKAR